MKPAYIFGVVFLLVLVEIYSLLPHHSTLEELRPNTSATPAWVQGAIHVRSQYSPNGAPIPELVEAAHQAGLGFLVIADAGSVRARRDGWERPEKGVDIFVEIEAKTPAGNVTFFYSHTAARTRSAEDLSRLAWDHFLGKESVEGAFVIGSQSTYSRGAWNRLDRFPEGIEVMSWYSEWQRQTSESLISLVPTMAIYPFNNYLALLRFLQPNRKDFVAWDAMNSFSEGHFGILGDDWSTLVQKKFFNRPIDLSPSVRFRTASNVVLLPAPLSESFESRRQAIYSALRKGRAAIAFPLIHPLQGNDWIVECQGRMLRAGDRGERDGQACRGRVALPPHFPHAAEIQVWKDGELLRQIPYQAPHINWEIDAPGTYRIEVWARPQTLTRALLHSPVPYFLYNPISIR